MCGETLVETWFLMVGFLVLKNTPTF